MDIMQETITGELRLAGAFETMSDDKLCEEFKNTHRNLWNIANELRHRGYEVNANIDADAVRNTMGETVGYADRGGISVKKVSIEQRL